MNVLAAMSGGVDSSVVPLLLNSQGHNVIGVHMLLHKEDPEVCELETKTCCSSADALDAKKVAEAIGIEFDVIQMHDKFHEAVIQDFIDAYKSGRTPIPCTNCNGALKFNLLITIANALGAQKVATGHYIEQDKNSRLWASSNHLKDQSYYLWSIETKNLNRLLFPISNMDKESVRKMAREAHLPVANKRESQDICFVPKGDYREVLPKFDSYFTPREGKILDQNGKTIGVHQGHWNYTVGQRRGLPAVGHRIYVISINPETNTIVVGNKADTKTDSFAINNLNLHGDSFTHGFVKLGSRANYIPCAVRNNKVHLLQKANATPGQAAVFYSKHNNRYRLEGGAWIS